VREGNEQEWSKIGDRKEGFSVEMSWLPSRGIPVSGLVYWLFSLLVTLCTFLHCKN